MNKQIISVILVGVGIVIHFVIYQFFKSQLGEGIWDFVSEAPLFSPYFFLLFLIVTGFPAYFLLFWILKKIWAL